MRLSVLKRHRPAPPPGLPAGYSMGGGVGCGPVRPRFGGCRTAQWRLQTRSAPRSGCASARETI